MCGSIRTRTGESIANAEMYMTFGQPSLKGIAAQPECEGDSNRAKAVTSFVGYLVPFALSVFHVPMSRVLIPIET